MDNDTLNLLHQMGLTPLDWVDAKQFAALTGIAEQKLTHRKRVARKRCLDEGSW